jgi:C4-dicarboxylate transporter DctM subunit
MAIPFFIMAGDLAERSGILPNLVQLAKSLVGHWRAGLAHVSIVTEMFLSGVTGTAVGDAAAIGSIFIPSMIREGYDPKFAAVLTASASIMGPLIPPSVGMLIYSFVQGGSVSVAALFLAGVGPGVLVGLGLMALSHVLAKRRNYPKSQERFRILNVFRTLKGALMGLTAMIIILGASFLEFHPQRQGSSGRLCLDCRNDFHQETELFKHRHIDFKHSDDQLCHLHSDGHSQGLCVVADQRSDTADMWTFLMSVSTVLHFYHLGHSLLVFLGFFIEAIAIMIMFVPVLAPIAGSYGIEAHHFGLVFVMAVQML